MKINQSLSQGSKAQVSGPFEIKPDVWSLPNGMQVIFLRDPETPLVRGSLYFRGGGLWESDAETGFSGAMGNQLRQGGAGKLSPDALDQKLEELAAQISSNFGAENGKVAFACLGQDLNTVLGLVGDVVLRPRFDEDRLNLWKGQALESIRRRTDDPNDVAMIGFTQLIYGSSPYGRVVLEKDVLSLNRVGLLKMHRRFVRPNEAILAITGDISRENLKRMIEEIFSNWEKRSESLGPVPTLNFTPTPGIYFIELPFSQATIYLGQQGVPRLTPDYPAIDVFNDLFGSGGFSSRLTRRVRVELGLAYGLYGGIYAGPAKGRNFIMVQTKAETAAQAIMESLSELARMQVSPVTSEELTESKNAIENSFVFKFDNTDDLVQRAAALKLLSYPLDYDATYLDRIRAVGTEDLMKVAKTRWDLKNNVILVVGDNKAKASIEAGRALPNSPLAGLPFHVVKFNQQIILP